MIDMKIKGLEEVLQFMEDWCSAPRISKGCAADGYHEGGVANATILNSQAKEGRKPYFLDASDEQQGMELERQIVDAWTERNAGRVMDLARRIGQLFTDAVKRHINEGRSEDGPMKPLSKRYEAIKEHVYHAKGKPILVRSGQLLASLAPFTSVRGGR